MIPTERPRIAITMGDPCGVGPEILVKALASRDLGAFVPIVVGEPLALERACSLLDLPLAFEPVLAESLSADPPPGVIQVVTPQALEAADIAFGAPTRATAQAVIGYIEAAVQLTRTGAIDAICTCPIHKAQLHRHDFAFPGHTEFLRDLTGASDVVMMLAGPRLRVALVTIHHALAEVPQLCRDSARLRTTIAITAEALLRDFGFKNPRIAVAALNPHAGEAGRFGSEDDELIAPVIRELAGRFAVQGPFPADTLFFRAFEGEFDAVVAMYHDQGLIPIKLVHFHDAVNVSLGLPIIRTSVDHGTAYDLAGTGRAHAGSLTAALNLAASMVHNRRTAAMEHA